VAVDAFRREAKPDCHARHHLAAPGLFVEQGRFGEKVAGGAMLPGQCLGSLEIHWRGVRLPKRRRVQSGQAGETYQQQKERINTTPLSPLGQARSKREKRTSVLFRDDCLFFKFSTRKCLAFWVTVWPSASSFPRMASMPPGYFGMIRPSLLSVRH